VDVGGPRLMAKVQRLLPNLLLSLVTAGLFLGLLEGGARLHEAHRPARPVADYIWNWEERWDGDFYTVGSDAVGWPPWQEFNADGLRDHARPTQKLPGTERIIALGDSVTMGAGIEAWEAWPQRLEARYQSEGRPVEVLNVALWGWSTRQERIAYVRFGRPRKPDEVLLAVCLNDIPELQNNLTRPPEWLATLFQRSALVRWLVNAQGREIHDVEELFREPNSPAVKEALGRFFEEVRSLRSDVEADGGRLVVLVLPFRLQVLPKAPKPSVQRAILDFCKADGIRCLDLLPPLRAAGAPAFVDYDHLSAAGSDLVADQVKASGVVPEPPPVTSLAHDSMPTLVALLRAPDPAARAEAARELQGRGPDAISAAGALFDALADPSENVRWAAAQALWKVEGASASALPRLVLALKSPDPYVRGFAAWSLGNLGEAAREAVPALIDTVRAEEADGRGASLLALARLGPTARAAAPVLIETLASPHAPRRWNAARALGRIEAPEAVRPLMRALHDPDDHVRVHAARALGKLGPLARAAADALTAASGDPNTDVRQEAARALQRIHGIETPPATRGGRE
jgi:HEAT repeat protein/lysophospholipase L1-like esterase